MALAFTLGRATAGLLRAFTGRPAARPATAAPAASPRPNWREARHESLTLRHAVEAMEGHTDLLAQLADAWLLSANLKQFDIGRFYANVARSRDIAGALDEDCAAVVAELRALEHQRDCAAALEAEALRANQWADRMALATQALRAQVTALAQARGLEPATVFSDAARRSAETARAEVETLLEQYVDERPMQLKEWVR